MGRSFLRLLAVAGCLLAFGSPPRAAGAPDSNHRPATAPSRSTFAAPVPAGDIPRRIIIPAISLDAPVEPVKLIQSGRTATWASPNRRAAGWHNTSARLGQAGNVVLNGHHNIKGKVFARLYELKPGDTITLAGATLTQTYVVTEILLLLELNQPLDVRLRNAAYIQPTADDRLTLVTCHPPTGNKYRLIVIAEPRR